MKGIWVAITVMNWTLASNGIQPYRLKPLQIWVDGGFGWGGSAGLKDSLFHSGSHIFALPISIWPQARCMLCRLVMKSGKPCYGMFVQCKVMKRAWHMRGNGTVVDNPSSLRILFFHTLKASWVQRKPLWDWYRPPISIARHSGPQEGWQKLTLHCWRAGPICQTALLLQWKVTLSIWVWDITAYDQTLEAFTPAKVLVLPVSPSFLQE